MDIYQSGEVLAVEWNDRPIRVIVSDAVETFYDVLWPELGWGLRRARTAIYYRAKTNLLNKTASHLRSESLSPTEFAKHRPDLPMRLFQHSEADWSDDINSILALEPNSALNAMKFVLIPFGAQGALAKPVNLQNKQLSISLHELVKAAHDAQQTACPNVKGVGIYRSGIVGGIPSYYLWGSVDRAGNSC